MPKETLFSDISNGTKFVTYGGGENTIFQKQNHLSSQELDKDGKPVRTWRFRDNEVVNPI